MLSQTARSHSFYGCVVFPCVYIYKTHLLYPWTLRLLPYLSYCNNDAMEIAFSSPLFSGPIDAHSVLVSAKESYLFLKAETMSFIIFKCPIIRFHPFFKNYPNTTPSIIYFYHQSHIIYSFYTLSILNHFFHIYYVLFYYNSTLIIFLTPHYTTSL